MHAQARYGACLHLVHIVYLERPPDLKVVGHVMYVLRQESLVRSISVDGDINALDASVSSLHM